MSFMITFGGATKSLANVLEEILYILPEITTGSSILTQRHQRILGQRTIRVQHKQLLLLRRFKSEKETSWILCMQIQSKKSSYLPRGVICWNSGCCSFTSGSYRIWCWAAGCGPVNTTYCWFNSGLASGAGAPLKLATSKNTPATWRNISAEETKC